MEIFYSNDISAGICRFDKEESAHIVRVLRRRPGEGISVFDGQGNLYRCILSVADPAGAQAQILEQVPDWGAVPYRLTMAVCPTKNSDRTEWFAEKAAEMGVDAIVPLVSDHSERRVLKTDRLRRILLSATKQSLKGRIPSVSEPVRVRDFILGADPSSLNLIAFCFDLDASPKRSVTEVLDPSPIRPVNIMIGPEGDFSREEAALAVERGFIPVHLGTSRLRTETAALAAVAALYLKYSCI